jgi:hypothetical protein
MADQKIYKLYDGEVEVKFNVGNHQYFVDGKKTQGVTTILGVLGKPQLIYWAVDCAIKNLQAVLDAGERIDESHLESAKSAHVTAKTTAGDTGATVHRWVECYLKGMNPAMPEGDALNSVNAFLTWEKSHQVEWMELERVVYSRQFDYVGRFDAIAKIDGKLSLIDFKTSKSIYPEMLFQVSAYRQAYEEEVGKKEMQNVILRFDKITGEPHTEIAKYPKEDFDTFRACLIIKKRELLK